MSEEVKNENVKTGNIDETKSKNTKFRRRTLLVLIVLAIFIICSFIIMRADYIETLEIGEEYAEVFMQNMKYKRNIAILNFIFVFGIAYITNGFIKKGLRKFFDDDKKEMPKLPNKSLAFIMALVTSTVVSNMFLQKVILFVNASQFGIQDPVFNMDVGFYMFSMPLIGQLLYYGVTLLIILTIYIAIYYIVVFNKFFDGIDRKNT